MNTVIETTDIVDIYDVERDKIGFKGREAGFIIEFMDGSTKVFKENIPYERTNGQIGAINDKWRRLMDKVYNKWQEDKHDMPEFKL